MLYFGCLYFFIFLIIVFICKFILQRIFWSFWICEHVFSDCFGKFSAMGYLVFDTPFLFPPLLWLIKIQIIHLLHSFCLFSLCKSFSALLTYKVSNWFQLVCFSTPSIKQCLKGVILGGKRKTLQEKIYRYIQISIAV